ncbi:hypothetical protein HHK36_000405 [Tetracentron sinense]|uniref:Derlin n=1 Tax=Tetracentron sinense TaxID=13715 RepID=A0A835DQR3_TETSI|nr:hypothetical protein HHK36_000405 [Tetracentron sinense]
MSTPGEYYRSLPPVSKAYGVACLMTTSAFYLQLYDPMILALFYERVLKHFQVWRLITNFFFLGPFSFRFAVRLLMIARYGVLLEKGPYDKRTADFVWMLIFGALSILERDLDPPSDELHLGASLHMCAMSICNSCHSLLLASLHGGFLGFHDCLCLELRVPECTNQHIRCCDLEGIDYGFYLPWALLALDLILGNSLKPDIIGMVAGHLYYFLTVLHPLAGGKFILKTPLWVHKFVAYWGEGTQINSPVQPDPSAGVAFRGRSYRLNGR